MNDKFSILPLPSLLRILLKQYDKGKRILGVLESNFFNPNLNDSFRILRFNKELESPIGLAAGPHTQLAQNIVIGWLVGARFIELKTIQTLDELDVSKPCIDMQDEGYNCEWSQELKIQESFDQYLDAWIIIHILRHKLYGLKSGHPGFIFNMSVGYDLEGIMQNNVQWFLNKMIDVSKELTLKKDQIRSIYPQIDEIEIESCMSDNITLSTMHGCPPGEIEKIGAYLITERKLHTAIKLNPTLLGSKQMGEILKNSDFDTEVPQSAFEHDLKYDAALKIISSLRGKAKKVGVSFALKLTNTLESNNHKQVFGGEKMMYMSGRALHPIAVNLAAKLQNDHNGELDISFSGGANADNISSLVKSGLTPVTVCSDLLKPGGFVRLKQYIFNLRETEDSSNSLDQFRFLSRYAKDVLKDKAYKKTMISDPDLKTNRKLETFDCIQAPCVDTCPTNQDIPSYLHYAAIGDFENSYKVIRDTNPFPLTTGMICDHLCQTKCVRIHYDSPVLIREVKRFVAEYAQKSQLDKLQNTKSIKKKVAIIGAGPSGLSCAYFLAKAGMQVDVYEASEKLGGMISHAIPSFRLFDEATELDIETILKTGVKIHYGHVIDRDEFNKLREISDFVYIGAGAQSSSKLRLKGSEMKNVLDPLEFLFDVKEGKRPNLGKNVLIIGGGNTAMDAARTASRLIKDDGQVTIIYRRSIKQMPADQGEIKAVLKEGVNIVELCNPVEIKGSEGQVQDLRCQKMKLGLADASGRPRPEAIEGEYIDFSVDTLIPAIGQEKAFDFGEKALLKQKKDSYETHLSNVFIGGDAMRGASTAINAIGDGRKVANEILFKAGLNYQEEKFLKRAPADFDELMNKKAFREESLVDFESDVSEWQNFEVGSRTLSENEVRKEASRCLKCDEICSLCTTVCPNLAFQDFRVLPADYKTQVVDFSGDEAIIKDGKAFSIQQEYQILHIADWCNLCGNCTTFCPTSGSPYKEKAHLYLNEEDFLREKDGFYSRKSNGDHEILGFLNKELFKLKVTNDHYEFSSENFELKLSKINLNILEISRIEKGQEINTEFAIIMHTVLTGVKEFLQID